MGSIAPIATGIGSFATSLANTWQQGEGLYNQITGHDLRKAQKRERNQLQQAQATEMAGFGADVDRQRQALALNASTEEKRRLAALRRAMARTRVNSAANGIDPSDGGSSEAILLGLVNDTESDRQDSLAADKLHQRAIDDSIADRNRRNLLEAANLYERQRLQWKSRW